MAWMMWFALASFRAMVKSATNHDEIKPVATIPQRNVGRSSEFIAISKTSSLSKQEPLERADLLNDWGEAVACRAIQGLARGVACIRCMGSEVIDIDLIEGSCRLSKDFAMAGCLWTEFGKEELVPRPVYKTKYAQVPVKRLFQLAPPTRDT